MKRRAGASARAKEWLGFSWAMFIAGVPSIVVSQWKVESAGTRDLMVNFHRGSDFDCEVDKDRSVASGGVEVDEESGDEPSVLLGRLRARRRWTIRPGRIHRIFRIYMTSCNHAEILSQFAASLTPHSLNLAQQIPRDIGFGISASQQTKFLFGFFQEPRVRIKQAERQVRRGISSLRLRDLICFRLVEHAKLCLRRGRTRRSDFLPVFDCFHLPRINSPTRQDCVWSMRDSSAPDSKSPA